MVVIDQIPKGSDVERQPDRSNLSIPIWEQMSSRVALMLGLSVAISASSLFILSVVLTMLLRG
ncbi:MAG: hypothetical protein AAB668_01690 [Patescibacteria group bacterium]